jgi:hypothetical protein
MMQVLKIGLKVPKNHHRGKIQFCPLKTEDTKIGFPGYPDNRQHLKSVETVEPGTSAVSSTLTVCCMEGLGLFFDTKLCTYLPLPLPNAPVSRIDGEAVFVIELLNRRVESAREGPASTVLGELQDTKAWQELRAIKTAFERGRDVMQVFHL